VHALQVPTGVTVLIVTHFNVGIKGEAKVLKDAYMSG
jgi:hypothetical protein